MNIALNPLLDFSDLPQFSAIKPEYIGPAIDSLLDQARTVVKELEEPMTQVTWENFVQPLEDVTEKLGRAWGIVGHLNAVVDTPELRAAYNENQPKITEFWTALAQNLTLFTNYKALQLGPDYAGYSAARKKIIENAVRDFRLGGAELTEEEKPRFAEIQEKHAALTTKFSENILDATNDYALFVESEAELAGLPDDAKQAARAAAEKDGKPGYKFTLHFPSYFPYPAIRGPAAPCAKRSIARTRPRRPSWQTDHPAWDNTQNIVDILKLRDEEAKLLGYKNFAEVSLVSKMAQTPDRGDRLPAGSGQTRTPVCGKGSGGTAQLRAKRTGPRQTGSLGRDLRI
jgi:oligopeptidase A